MKTLGEIIAELRRERGLTQESLAGIIGISSQAISKWENNATMPDIMLLPIIADTLGVTIDELFGIKHKVQEKPIDCEETPMAVYDQVLNTMWRSEDHVDFAERAKSQFAKNPYQHSGFVSTVSGAVYANKDIALAYLPGDTESLKLLENEDTAELLKTISDKNVRLLLAYQLTDSGKAFTAASVAAKVGITEEEAKVALEKLVDCKLTMARDVTRVLKNCCGSIRRLAHIKCPCLCSRYSLWQIVLRITEKAGAASEHNNRKCAILPSVKTGDKGEHLLHLSYVDILLAYKIPPFFVVAILILP